MQRLTAYRGTHSQLNFRAASIGRNLAAQLNLLGTKLQLRLIPYVDKPVPATEGRLDPFLQDACRVRLARKSCFEMSTMLEGIASGLGGA